MVPGIPVARVVAVIAKLDTGKTQIGSGYLLDATHVLTARHCTRDKETGRSATGLSVIRASDGASAAVTVSEESPALDVALLAFSPDSPWGAELPDGAVTFGKVNRERAAQLDDCQAVGYPLWQASEFGDYRDLAELHGPIRALEGRENQRLVLRDPVLAGVGWARAGTGAAATAGESAWGGLSGAAVFHEGLLLGVIIEHHPRQGETALQIRPVDAIAAADDDATFRLGTALGIGEPGALHTAAGRPGAPADGNSGLPRWQNARLRVLSKPWPAPRLPDQYVDRVGEQREIGDMLGKEGARVAIYGLPGVGKTALAAKIAKTAPATLKMNTVLWADFGQGADPVDVLRRWCQDDALRSWCPELDAGIAAVTGTPQEQLAYLRERLSDAVSGKRVLFVLDDVGSSQADIGAAAACVIDDENCRYLLTTISAVTASHLASHGFAGNHLDQLAPPEAEEVLERYADGKLSQLALSDADREHLLLLGSGLPLGLMVLGRFLQLGLTRGGQLPRLLRKLDNAEALVQERDLAVRLRAGGEERGSIDAILMAHWIDLPAGQKEALQTAAVFRGKPHAFEEAAWACILEARQASAEDPEEPEELAQRLGASLGRAENDPELRTETGDLVGISSLDGEDDEDLQQVIEAVEKLEPLREALMETGLLEQPVTGEPSFTMHSSIAAFVRTVCLFRPEDIPVLDPAELMRVHRLAARYYRGWLGGYQDGHALASPYAAAYRFENRQWLNATLDLCYHLREAGSEDEALLALTTLFFDAFWWWGELVPYPPCEELLRMMWQLAHLGAKATRCLRELHKFKDNYPIIDLGIVPSHDRRALPSGYQDGTKAAHFQAVRQAVTSIRDQVLGGVIDDAAAERDRARLRMLTAIFLGVADRVTGQFEEADRNYQEALRLLEEPGADGYEDERDDSDDWIIPYVYGELADLYVRAGTPEKALRACVLGVRSAASDGAALPDDLGDGDIDHEVLGRLWLAAGNARWKAGWLPEAWRSYAWACFHACACTLWPRRIVLYERPGARPERVREFGVDDYTVMCYKLNLATMLDRLGELWRDQRRAEACDGVRIIRETLAGGPDRPGAGPGEPGPRQLEEKAAERPETAWEDCRDLAWQDTGLSGLALPLIPWDKLTGADGLVDRKRVEEQRRTASDLTARLRDIWVSSKWTLREGPGQVQGGGPTREVETDLPKERVMQTLPESDPEPFTVQASPRRSRTSATWSPTGPTASTGQPRRRHCPSSRASAPGSTGSASTTCTPGPSTRPARRSTRSPSRACGPGCWTVSATSGSAPWAGDIGAGVSNYLALNYPERVTAVHRMDAGVPAYSGDPADLTPDERAWMADMAAWSAAEGAYMAMHRTKPQTAAVGLTDSPAGLAAWIVEKLRAWSDCGGDISRSFTMDEILTNVTIYWLTETIGSSMRMYHANGAIPPAQQARRVEVPSGFTQFPANISRAPRTWLERTTNLVRLTQAPRGGHFAPLEEPEFYAEELRAFFRPYRA